MVDITQRNIPRHPNHEITRLVSDLKKLTAQDTQLWTTDQTLAVIHELITAKLDQGIQWRRLEVWLKRKGFPDITQAVYYDWIDRNRK